MKLISKKAPRGFTLIELLVVIAIIAVLAGLAIPAANVVLRKARETQARAGVQGLAMAVKGYQTEYNRLPNPTSNVSPTETQIDTDSTNEMISTLLARNTTYNTREISFYDPPTAKNEANGLITSGTKNEVVDPWSKPNKRQYYHMVLDYSGDRKITNPVKTQATKFSASFIAAEPTDITGDVAVYSDNDPLIPSTQRKPITSW